MESEIPHDHDEGSDERNGKSHENAGPAADFSNENVPDHPCEIAICEIGRTDQQRHQEQLRPERIGVVVVTEGKAGKDARVFQDVAYHEKDDDECDDAVTVVADGSMYERNRKRDRLLNGNRNAVPE